MKYIFEVTVHYAEIDIPADGYRVVAEDDVEARRKALELDAVAWQDEREGGELELADEPIPTVDFCEITLDSEIDG